MHHDRRGLVGDPLVTPLDTGENFTTAAHDRGAQSTGVNFAEDETGGRVLG